MDMSREDALDASADLIIQDTEMIQLEDNYKPQKPQGDGQ